jgi:hypothetical protein
MVRTKLMLFAALSVLGAASAKEIQLTMIKSTKSDVYLKVNAGYSVSWPTISRHFGTTHTEFGEKDVWKKLIMNPNDFNKGAAFLRETNLCLDAEPGEVICIKAQRKGFFKTYTYKQIIDTRYSRGTLIVTDKGIKYVSRIGVRWQVNVPNHFVGIRVNGRSVHTEFFYSLINPSLSPESKVAVYDNKHAYGAPYDEQEKAVISLTAQEIADKAGLAFHELDGKTVIVGLDSAGAIQVTVE